MNDQATGTTPVSRMAASSTTPRPSTLQRPREPDRTYWRSLVRSSAASCWARFDASAMSTRCATGAGRAKPPGGAVLSGPATLHAEQVAQLQEEPVPRTGQVLPEVELLVPHVGSQ